MRDLFFYLLAVVFGISAGILEIKLGDLLVTALFIMICTMALGASRPQRAWRWIVIVAIFVPILRIAAYLVAGQKPYFAQSWEAAFAFVIAAVGTYAGVFARKAAEGLFREGGNTPR